MNVFNLIVLYLYSIYVLYTPPLFEGKTNNLSRISQLHKSFFHHQLSRQLIGIQEVHRKALAYIEILGGFRMKAYGAFKLPLAFAKALGIQLLTTKQNFAQRQNIQMKLREIFLFVLKHSHHGKLHSAQRCPELLIKLCGPSVL